LQQRDWEKLMEDETRATARLPHLEVEIRYRRLPEGQVEQLAISLEATPSFADFAQFLDRQAPWPLLALQPWLVWGQVVRAAWQPWLAAVSAVTGVPSSGPRAHLPEERFRPRRSSPGCS
jgi:hypothetical protein